MENRLTKINKDAALISPLYSFAGEGPGVRSIFTKWIVRFVYFYCLPILYCIKKLQEK